MRRRTLLLVPIVLLLGVAYFLAHQADPEPESRYPEFRGVNPVLRDLILATLDQHGKWSAPRDCTPVALLAALCERFPESTGGLFPNPYFTDAEARPYGTWIARRAEPDLNPLLLRIAADAAMGELPRQAAITALCRPGNESVISDLLGFVLDPEQSPTFQHLILQRIHRIGASPAPELSVLIRLPYRDLDLLAAATLALAGEPVAPSLIRDALPGDTDLPGANEHLAARAAAVIARDDPAFRALVDRALPILEKRSWTEGEGPEPSKQWPALLEEIAARFDKWLAAHPEVFRSGFEEERAAYRSSVLRRREESVKSFDDILALPEEDLDFAAAALVLACATTEDIPRFLERLDRLASLFRREIEGVSDPVAVLAVLHRRLLSRNTVTSGPRLEWGTSSFLPDVLTDRCGNCLGLVSLYIALGDRLGLPLRAVRIPRHVFLRWDDGTAVVDFELTDLGAVRSERDLKGAEPRVVGKRELLSVILSNLSAAWLGSKRVPDDTRAARALAFAEQALQLDASNPSAFLGRAQALVKVDPGLADTAFEALRLAMALDPQDVSPYIVGAEINLFLGRREEALTWYDRAIAHDDGYVPARIGRLQTLAALDRHEQVVASADAFLVRFTERGPVLPVYRLRYFSLVHLGDPRWRKELADLPLDSVERRVLTIETAEALLTEGRAVPVDAATALRLLRAPPKQVAINNRNRARELEAEALEKLGRNDEARRIRSAEGRE